MTIWGASDGVKGVPFETMTWDIWVSFRKVRHSVLVSNVILIASQILFSEIIICHFTYGLIKISVLLFYKRIFNINKSFRTYANIVLGINVAWMISAFFVSLNGFSTADHELISFSRSSSVLEEYQHSGQRILCLMGRSIPLIYPAL